MTSVPAGVEAGPRRVAERNGTQDHLGTLARSGTLSLVGAATAGILGFVLVVVVTRGLGPAGSGPLFVCITLFLILAEIATLGADTGLMRSLAGLRALGRHHEMRETVPVAVVPVVVTATLFAAIVFTFAPEIARVLITNGGADAGADYLRALAPFLPLAAVSTVVLSGARGLGSMGPYVYLDRIGVPVARPLLVGAALSLGFGGTAVALAWAVPVAVEVALATVALVVLLRRTGTAVGAARRPRREVAGPV
ncbi:MAG TPA: MATE family efflux transporter, partial [Actinomycetota bacterium]